MGSSDHGNSGQWDRLDATSCADERPRLGALLFAQRNGLLQARVVRGLPLAKSTPAHEAAVREAAGCRAVSNYAAFHSVPTGSRRKNPVSGRAAQILRSRQTSFQQRAIADLNRRVSGRKSVARTIARLHFPSCAGLPDFTRRTIAWTSDRFRRSGYPVSSRTVSPSALSSYSSACCAERGSSPSDVNQRFALPGPSFARSRRPCPVQAW